MNLGKLLGVGRSFFGNGQAVAYRENKHVRLPKFNEGKNPFDPKMSEAAAEAAPRTAAEPPPFILNGKGKATDPMVANASAPAVVRKETAPAPYALQSAAAPAAKPVTQPAAKPARQGWTTRLNPFRPPEPVAPPVGEQMKLSLDSVKVVTNDLADADVEVVPVKSHNAAPTVVVLPPARRAWEYLGENIMKSS